MQSDYKTSWYLLRSGKFVDILVPQSCFFLAAVQHQKPSL